MAVIKVTVPAEVKNESQRILKLLKGSMEGYIIYSLNSLIKEHGHKQ